MGGSIHLYGIADPRGYPGAFFTVPNKFMKGNETFFTWDKSNNVVLIFDGAKFKN